MYQSTRNSQKVRQKLSIFAQIPLKCRHHGDEPNSIVYPIGNLLITQFLYATCSQTCSMLIKTLLATLANKVVIRSCLKITVRVSQVSFLPAVSHEMVFSITTKHALHASIESAYNILAFNYREIDLNCSTVKIQH